jgi:hypothetical protein
VAGIVLSIAGFAATYVSGHLAQVLNGDFARRWRRLEVEPKETETYRAGRD